MTRRVKTLVSRKIITSNYTPLAYMVKNKKGRKHSGRRIPAAACVAQLAYNLRPAALEHHAEAEEGHAGDAGCGKSEQHFSGFSKKPVQTFTLCANTNSGDMSMSPSFQVNVS